MIKSIYIEEIKNESKVSKNGKPYITCSIKSDNQWMNGFGNKLTESWQQGMTVELDVYGEEYNGKIYKKFKTIRKEDLLEQRISELEERMDAMAEWAREISKSNLQNLKQS